MRNAIATAIIFVLFLMSVSFAAINPIYKECVQRGYEIMNDECVFPDNTSCSMQDFNAGACGQVLPGACALPS